MELGAGCVGSRCDPACYVILEPYGRSTMNVMNLDVDTKRYLARIATALEKIAERDAVIDLTVEERAHA